MATGWLQTRNERPRLTSKFVQALPPADRQVIIYDPDLVGFGLRVTPASPKNPTGTRTWILEYRPGHGGRRVNKKRVSLGRVEVVSADDARRHAKTLLAELTANGIDPAEQVRKSRTALKISELQQQYLTATNPHRKPRTRDLYESAWKNYINPAFGNLFPDEVTKTKVVGLHNKIGIKHQSTANLVVVLLSHFFGWCRENGHYDAPTNPARGIKKFKIQARRRYLSQEEFARLGRAIKKAETQGIAWSPNPARLIKHAAKPENRRVKVSPFAASALRLLLFTGARLREILHLEWSHVDLDRGLLILPDSKTGAKVIILAAPAIETIESLKPLRSKKKGARFVIEGNDPSKARADLHRPWRLVRNEAGLVDFRLHDLRHSFASIGAGSNLGLPVIGALLGHANPSTTARYAHLANEPLRAASENINQRIKELLDG